VKYTPNLNLKKPDTTDLVLIDDLNDNMDILDQEVQDIRGTIDQEVQDIRGTIDQEIQGVRDTLDQEVQDIRGLIDQEVEDIRGIINQKIQDVRNTIDQEVQDIRDTIDQEVRDLQSIINQEIQGVRNTIDQEVQDIRDTIDQEVQDLQGIIDNTVQALDAHTEARATLNALGHVNHAVLTTTIDTAWQGSMPPYTKTQTVNGLLATDTPIVDVVMSGDFGTDEARIRAWGYVYRITTANNAITLYATGKPAVSLPIQLKVVR